MDCETIALPCLEQSKKTDSSTILLIEDDHLQVEFLEHGLKSQGFRVLSATTCDGGFRLARSETPDIILLDVLLPDGSGLDLCHRMADDERTCNIPVIIVSGVDEDDIVKHCRSAGSYFFLKKPYDPNALLLLINSTLDDSSDR